MKISIKEIRYLLESKLKSIGFTSTQSRIIADEYIESELKNKRTHGLYNFIWTFPKLKNTRRRAFQVIRNKSAYAYIQGNDDVGQLVAHYAIELAVKKAKKMGIGMVGAGNTQAFARPGTWAEVAARKNMIGLCFNYGGGPLMATSGAREPILSTNPIGIGIPHRPYPIVIDMAVSQRAYNYVKLFEELHKKITQDYGIDKNGRLTNDPKKVIAVLPFGGYKGYALGLALEILTGPLMQTKVGKRTEEKRGFLFIVINPKIFTTFREFNRDVSRLLKEVKTAKKMPGVREIYIPGEQSFKLERQKLKKGYIEIDNKIIDQLKAL